MFTCTWYHATKEETVKTRVTFIYFTVWYGSQNNAWMNKDVYVNSEKKTYLPGSQASEIEKKQTQN